MTELKKINDFKWEIPKTGGMKVPTIVYASEKLLEIMKKDKTLLQAQNFAHLPGIYKAMVMPDGHQGYGFPIGGVAALDFETGGISPGGIGYDINCGVRLLSTNLIKDEAEEKIDLFLDALYKNVPAGLGSSNITVDLVELDKILNTGAKWAVENGYGTKEDLDHCEEYGSMPGADSSAVSDQAKKRGKKQIATLGSGNHFLEMQYVDEIYDEETAKVFGIEKKGQIVIMIHCGSRGLGHQVCSDYLREMEKEYPDLVAGLPDRELIYAPAGSNICKRYYGAMAAAANFAWCNRHVIAHQVRLAYKEVFGKDEIKTVYDVAHNIAKIEEHEFEGKKIKVYMHRKGATRAFGPGRKEVPEAYREVGQPIIIPGSMGTASYVLVGTEKGMQETFGSTAHGAGRTMSRHAAIDQFRGEKVKQDLLSKGIHLKQTSWKGVAEEAPLAYKDIDEVVNVSHKAGIGNLVVRLKPLGVIKG
ncbi:RtcB family protein [Nanoarchaeota archaeon]